MTQLVACLDKERETRWDISTKILATLIRRRNSTIINYKLELNNSVGGGLGQFNLENNPLLLCHKSSIAQKLDFKIPHHF